MRKTYELPENASLEHMTSFLTAKGTLVVEFPLVTPVKERGKLHFSIFCIYYNKNQLFYAIE